MTLVDSKPATWPARLCSVEVPRRDPANAPQCDDNGTNDDEQTLVSSSSRRAGRLAHRRIIKSTQKEDVDSVHTLGFGFGCTGIGLGRTGMFSKEWRICRGRGWFESHLVHVFSLFRGL